MLSVFNVENYVGSDCHIIWEHVLAMFHRLSLLPVSFLVYCICNIMLKGRRITL